MKRPTLLFANDKNAAALFDLKTTDFHELVSDGVLPKPTKIGTFERWDVEQLQSIARGEFVDGGQISW